MFKKQWVESMRNNIIIAIVCLLVGYGISDINHNVDDWEDAPELSINYKH